MFGANCGQAEGLKEWFRPAPGGRIDLLSVDADDTAVELASLMDLAAEGLSLKLAWEDPLGLLLSRRVDTGADRTADIVVAVNRSQRIPGAQQSRCLGTMFTALPKVESLPSIYAAIKAAVPHGQDAPVTIVWTGRTAQQRLYEENLARTTHRFLGVSLNFLADPQAWLDASCSMNDASDSIPHFLRPLADLVRTRFGGLPLSVPALQN